jgi:hypothetical protein
VILIVAALSSCIASTEGAAGHAGSRTDWVRTADGWESRTALAVPAKSPRVEIHPALVAALQLGLSLMALVAFPGKAVPAADVPASTTLGRRRRRGSLPATAAGAR